jgi:hypothetical protein
VEPLLLELVEPLPLPPVALLLVLPPDALPLLLADPPPASDPLLDPVATEPLDPVPAPASLPPSSPNPAGPVAFWAQLARRSSVSGRRGTSRLQWDMNVVGG